MTSKMIESRNAFIAAHPEVRREVNGRSWGVIRVGDAGPALILLPGTLGRADIFWNQIAALSGEARILCVSYPASGSIADWAADIAAIVDAEDLAGATALGTSLGGFLAQYLTGTHPDLFGGLVAANTLPSTVGIEHKAPYSLDIAIAPIDTLRSSFSVGIEAIAAPGTPYANVAELLLGDLEQRISDAELRARIQALKFAPPLAAQALPPTRICTVESDDDHLITPPVRAALRAALHPARAFRFRMASHFPYLTRADAYTALLREVLDLPADTTTWAAGQEAIL